MIDRRIARGEMIAQRKTIHKHGNGWLVPSQTTDKKYFVDEGLNCNCPDSVFHNRVCKHAYAVKYFLKMEIETEKGRITVEKPISYPQMWHEYTQAQNSEVNEFDHLLSDLVQNIEEPTQERGRPRLSLRESVFCTVQKVYSQLSSRRAHSLYRNAEGKEQIAQAPNYNAINKLLNRESLTPILQELIALSASPLKSVESVFAVDSTGFRTSSYAMYAYCKYGGRIEHEWIKAHACVGVKTNVVASVVITGEEKGDNTIFPEVLNGAQENGFEIKEILADKGYSSRASYQVAKNLGAQAYIPFKTNATGNSNGCKLWRKMFLYFQLNQEEFMQHYHKRSNIESAFASIKKKFGDSLKSKNKTARINELLCKILAYNIVVLIHEMHEMKIKIEFSTPPMQ
jgi:transposase